MGEVKRTHERQVYANLYIMLPFMTAECVCLRLHTLSDASTCSAPMVLRPSLSHTSLASDAIRCINSGTAGHCLGFRYCAFTYLRVQTHARQNTIMTKGLMIINVLWNGVLSLIPWLTQTSALFLYGCHKQSRADLRHHIIKLSGLTCTAFQQELSCLVRAPYVFGQHFLDELENGGCTYEM